MRKRTSVEVVGAALATALGLLGGCGGITTLSGGGDGGPSTGEGGPPTKPVPGSTTTCNSPFCDVPPATPTTCAAHPCVNPTPLVVANVDTGYDTCAGGPLRRRAAVDCPSLVPRAAASCVGGGTCTTDSDCRDQPLGFCTHGIVTFTGDITASPCTCNYGCVRDSDCGINAMCVCGDPVGYCGGSACSSERDCQSGCGCIAAGTGAPYLSFQCQTSQDTCLTNADCADVATNPPGQAVCQPDGTGAWNCVLPGVTGRPFLVHGRERVAVTIYEETWARLPSAPEIAASTCLFSAAAAHWRRAGLMEHASIAAFARFTLHLLALGAPPELVRNAQEAMGDETEHARLAFGLASAFAGRAMGPGPLAIEGALDGFDLRDFIATLIREGCIGETVAAIEAREALEDVTDPAVRAVLETIARDELRHAALAWRALGWVVSSGRANRELVRSEVVRALREVSPRARPTHDDETLRPFGIVSEARREELRLTALSSLIGRFATAVVSTARSRTDRTPSVRVGA